MREDRLLLVVEHWLRERASREQRSRLLEHHRVQVSAQVSVQVSVQEHHPVQAHRRERRQVQASGQVHPVVGHRPATRLGM